MAQQFHHSSQTHNNHYSSSTIVTNPDSNKINNVLVAYRFIWSALGDCSSSTTIRSNEVSHRNFSRADLDNTAKRAYSSASARATNQQASAVMHLMNNFQHAFVLFGCGELDQYQIPDVVINVKRYSDTEVLSALVQRIKQLDISKKDRSLSRYTLLS